MQKLWDGSVNHLTFIQRTRNNFSFDPVTFIFIFKCNLFFFSDPACFHFHLQCGLVQAPELSRWIWAIKKIKKIVKLWLVYWFQVQIQKGSAGRK